MRKLVRDDASVDRAKSESALGQRLAQNLRLALENVPSRTGAWDWIRSVVVVLENQLLGVPPVGFWGSRFRIWDSGGRRAATCSRLPAGDRQNLKKETERKREREREKRANKEKPFPEMNKYRGMSSYLGFEWI